MSHYSRTPDGTVFREVAGFPDVKIEPGTREYRRALRALARPAPVPTEAPAPAPVVPASDLATVPAKFPAKSKPAKSKRPRKSKG